MIIHHQVLTFDVLRRKKFVDSEISLLLTFAKLSISLHLKYSLRMSRLSLTQISPNLFLL